MSNEMDNASTQERILAAFRLMIVNLVLNTNRIAEKLHCNPSDLQVLNLVELAGPLTPRELADRTNLTTGGVTVVLDRLEKDNLIKREKHPTDRRSLLITLSSSQRREEVNQAYQENAAQLLKTLSEYSQAEMATILSFLEKINRLGIPEKAE